MTEAFIKFYESNCPDINVNDEEVHAWLSAFVREVRSRWEPSGVLMGDSANLGLAFDEVVREFGLEER